MRAIANSLTDAQKVDKIKDKCCALIIIIIIKGHFIAPSIN